MKHIRLANTRHGFLVPFLAIVAALLGLSTAADAAIVSYDFHATNLNPFSIIEAGDTVHGSFQYDTSDMTGAGGVLGGLLVLSEQNAAPASMHITYTDLSTGDTATGTTDPGLNVGPDLRVSSNSSRFDYMNFVTAPNSVFGGMSFDDVLVRFTPSSASLPADLNTLTPTFVTMVLGVRGVPFGPNFTIDYIRPSAAPEPTVATLLGIGLAALTVMRRRRRV